PPRARERAGCASTRTSFVRCGTRLRVQRDRELVGARQLLEMSKREMLEEHRCRAVQQGTPESLTAANDVDEPTLVQRLEHATHGDAANLFDLRAADRLAIRDDGERLERRGRQPLRAGSQLRALDRLRVLG